MKVVLVPATYNEKGNIEKFISIVEEEVFPKIKDHEMQILVADDNSPDGTADVVRTLMKKYKNLNISSGEKKGLGAAYLRAMSFAIEKMDADVLISIDADLQHDPHSIPAFLEKLTKGYDVVTGTRYSEGGSMPKNWPLYRKILSVGANTLVRVITGRIALHDWTGGFRAYKKEVFLKEKEKLKSYSGYTFQVAALYKSVLDGFKVGEVPIHFYSRKVGDSKIAPIEYIYNLFKYVVIERIKELKRVVKFLIVGGSGFILQTTVQEIIIRVGIATFLATLLISNSISHASTFDELRDTIGAFFGAETAIICNFMFNNFWTFKDTGKIKENRSLLYRLLKFNLTSVGAILIQSLSVYMAVKYLGPSIKLASFAIPTRIAVLFPAIIFLVIPLNYLIYNKIIWKTQYLKKYNEK